MNKHLFAAVVVLFSTLLCPDLSAQAKNQLTHKGFTWRMDGEKIKWKLVKAEINNVPEAAVYLKKSLTNTTLSNLTMAGAATFSYLGRQRTDKNTGQFHEKNWGLTITSLVLMSTATYFALRSSKYLKQAVSTHNTRRIVTY